MRRILYIYIQVEIESKFLIHKLGTAWEDKRIASRLATHIFKRAAYKKLKYKALQNAIGQVRGWRDSI